MMTAAQSASSRHRLKQAPVRDSSSPLAEYINTGVAWSGVIPDHLTKVSDSGRRHCDSLPADILKKNRKCYCLCSSGLHLLYFY